MEGRWKEVGGMTLGVGDFLDIGKSRKIGLEEKITSAEGALEACEYLCVCRGACVRCPGTSLL